MLLWKVFKEAFCDKDKFIFLNYVKLASFDTHKTNIWREKKCDLCIVNDPKRYDLYSRDQFTKKIFFSIIRSFSWNPTNYRTLLVNYSSYNIDPLYCACPVKMQKNECSIRMQLTILVIIIKKQTWWNWSQNLVKISIFCNTFLMMEYAQFAHTHAILKP
jgi:hypothetical protein